MKKIIALLLVLVLLAGCSSGGNSTSKATRTCSYEMSGMTLTMVAEAPSEDANVEIVTMNCTAPYETMGITEDMLTDEVKEQLSGQLEETVAQSMGAELGSEGITIKRSEFTDSELIIEIEMNITVLAESAGTTNQDLSLDSFASSMTESGFDCK